MAIKEIPKTYQTSDGKGWDTKQEAERHEVFITKRNALERAQSEFDEALAQTHKLGDGSIFTSAWGRYWYLTAPFFQMPELVQVVLNGRSDKFEEMPNGKMRVGVTRYDDRQGERVDWFEFDRLFKDETLGRIALLAAREKCLAEAAEQVEETKYQVYKLQGGQDD